MSIPRGLPAALAVDEEAAWFSPPKRQGDSLALNRIGNDLNGRPLSFPGRSLRTPLIHRDDRVQAFNRRKCIMPDRGVMHDKQGRCLRPFGQDLHRAREMVTMQDVGQWYSFNLVQQADDFFD